MEKYFEEIGRVPRKISRDNQAKSLFSPCWYSLLLSSESLGTRQWASTTLSSRSLRIEALQSTHRECHDEMGSKHDEPTRQTIMKIFCNIFTLEVKTTWNGWDVTSFSGHHEWTSPHNCSSNLTFLSSSLFFHRSDWACFHVTESKRTIFHVAVLRYTRADIEARNPIYTENRVNWNLTFPRAWLQHH